MKKIVMWLGKESTKNIFKTVDLVIMLCLLFFYLLNADLSTAPEFIYNQF